MAYINPAFVTAPSSDLILSSSTNIICLSASVLNFGITGSINTIFKSNSRLIFSPGDGLAFVISGSDNRVVFGGDASPGNGHAVTNTTDLILRSAVGLVTCSSSFRPQKVTVGTLPVAATWLSGAIVYVSDATPPGCAIYGPTGWARILTGSIIA